MLLAEPTLWRSLPCATRVPSLVLLFALLYLCPVLLASGAFAGLALLARLDFVAFLKGRLELARPRRAAWRRFFAARDLDFRGLLYLDAVLTVEFGRHRECFPAQVEALGFGHVGGQRRVRPRRERR